MANAKLQNTITFSEEQGMLLETAENFFLNRAPVTGVRDLMLSEHGYVPEVWQEMVALGWSGIAVPEAYGGSDLGLAAATCVAEPMGRYLSATPWLATQLAIQGVVAAPDNIRDTYLADLAEGSVATVALAETNGAWDLNAPQLEVVNSDAHAELSGNKTFVLSADQADLFVVSGTSSGKPCVVFVTRADLEDSKIVRETVIDETRRSFEVDFTGVQVDRTQAITDDRAQHILARIQAAALLLISAESAGGIAGVLAVIVEYLNTREAFGRKIGSYQGLKHPTVDILIGLERARSHVYHAASLVDADQDALLALRMAKGRK